MSLELPSGIRVTNNVDADFWAGPYASLAAARAAVPVSMRLYRTVKVIESGSINEYVWRSGTLDADLERKSLTPVESDAAYEFVINKANSLVSNDNTHYPTTAAVKTADDTNLALAYAYTDSAVVGSFSYRGTHDGSSGNYPTTGGRGGSGVPIKGDAYEILAACTIQGVPYDQGDLIVAKVNTPAQTNSNWATSEHNTQQATTSMRGTAMIVDTTTIQNNATTDDQKIVTASKFWLGLVTFAGQTNTWATVQTFTSAPKFNSVTASQYLKTNGSKDLVSVASIPDSDISYTNQNANLVWAGPATGAAAAPTFRALVTADLAASLITYAKIQNVADGRLLGNATGGAAAPSEISVENGLTLSASKIKWGGALTAATTISSTGIVNALLFNGSFTTTANGQYFAYFNPSITTASYSANTIALGGSMTVTGAGIDGVGVVINPTVQSFGGITQILAANGTSLGSIAGITNGNYTLVPASTSGTGINAQINFTVTGGSTITINSVSVAGSGYRLGDTVTFNGTQFGGASGSNTFYVSTLNASTLTAPTALRIVHGTADSTRNVTKRYIDCMKADGVTSIFSIDHSTTNAAVVNLNLNDNAGAFISLSGSTSMTFSRSLVFSGNTLTINSSSTYTSPLTSTNQPTSASANFINNFTWSRSNSANNTYAAFTNKSTVVTVGVINTYTIAGSGTNGSYSNVSLSGGTGTGAIANTITVSGGVVTVMTLTGNNKGINYSVGDVLTGTITGGTATLTISSIDFSGNYLVSYLDQQTHTDAKSLNNYFSFASIPTYVITSGQVGSVGCIYYNPTLTNLGSFKINGFIIAPTAATNGLGVVNPRASLEICAQTSSRAAIILNPGTVISSTIGGAFEYNNSFYLTKNSGLRLGIGGSMFENFADAGNTTTTETDIFSYTTQANSFESNGAKIKATYSFSLVNSTSTKQIKVYFAGSVIFDSGALTVTAAANITLDVTIIRVNSTIVRYTVRGSGKNTSTVSFSETGELTSLTLSNTNILKTTGQAAGVGAATNDIVGKAADGHWFPVSNN